MTAQIDFDRLEDTAAPKFGPTARGGNKALLGDIVNTLVLYVFPIAGLALLLYLIYGGYHFMLSGGDPGRAQRAKAIMTNALLGFVIVFVAYWLVQIMGQVLGVGQIASIFGRP